MCSWSMLVITAIDGHNMRNDRSLSSASATMYSPRPSRALLPKALSRPPITAVGSSPPRSSTSAIIDVVLVLPCDPATAIENRSRISSASISARGITGIPRSRGRHDLRVARPHRRRDHHDVRVADVTRLRAPRTPSRRTPVRSRAVTSERLASDPLTAYPDSRAARRSRSSRCRRFRRSGSGGSDQASRCAERRRETDHRANSNTLSTITRAASGRAMRPAASAIRRRCPLVRRQRRESPPPADRRSVPAARPSAPLPA